MSEVHPAGIDEFLHTPARLSICSLLAPAESVTFGSLRDTTGTSDSAGRVRFEKHLSDLEHLVALARGTGPLSA